MVLPPLPPPCGTSAACAAAYPAVVASLGSALPVRIAFAAAVATLGSVDNGFDGVISFSIGAFISYPINPKSLSTCVATSAASERALFVYCQRESLRSARWNS